MRLTFWGTRGSIATPGKETTRYGGNTPCTEVRLRNNDLIILDAGTGIRNLGEQLLQDGNPIKAYLLISHPHWDHIQGFPFFRPALIAGNEFTIVGAESEKLNLQNMITDQMNKIYFPLQMNDLRAKLNFQRVTEENEINVFGAKIQILYVNHPSFALGYRINENGKSIVYISDNEPFDPELASRFHNVDRKIVEKYMQSDGDPNQRIYDFVRGADILIHDSTYTPDEYNERQGWGHSHYLFTLKIAAVGKVKKLILFHHDPSHTDDDVDAIYSQCKAEMKKNHYTFECVAATEGMVLET
ncbi:MAG: MBL fold metallo-hydrolase [Bacteroidota bacterium]